MKKFCKIFVKNYQLWQQVAFWAAFFGVRGGFLRCCCIFSLICYNFGEGESYAPRRNPKILNLESLASLWLPWLALVVAVFSVAIALYSVFLSRQTAKISRKMTRQQATLEFINAYNNDLRIEEAFVFLRNFSAGGQLPPNFDGSAERRNFLFLMNRFEMLAFGIKHKVYDKQMALDAFGYDLRQVYERSRSLVDYVRNRDQNPEAFLEFEALAKKVIARHK